MPNIYLPDDVKHWEFSQTLTDLGGDPHTDFRLSIAWDGQHYFEVTDELYGTWSKSLPKGASPSEAVPTNTGTAEQKPAAAEDAGPKPDKGTAPTTHDASPAAADDDKQETDGKATSPAAADGNATEPPAQSEKDVAAAAEKDASTTEPASEPEAEAAEPAQSSGTKRKPSAARTTSRRG